jgi:hypothetical protein
MSEVTDSVSSGVLKPSDISDISVECSSPWRLSLLIPAKRISCSKSLGSVKFLSVVGTFPCVRDLCLELLKPEKEKKIFCFSQKFNTVSTGILVEEEEKDWKE